MHFFYDDIESALVAKVYIRFKGCILFYSVGLVYDLNSSYL